MCIFVTQFVITLNHLLLFFFIIIILGNYRDYCDVTVIIDQFYYIAQHYSGQSHWNDFEAHKLD